MGSDDCVIFGLDNSTEIAKLIAKYAKIKFGKCHSHTFADGEFIFTLDETVRGKHVFLIKSTSKPVNNSIMQLLIATDAIKRSSAKSITAIIPYYGYSRQDRKTKGREPITSRLIADLFEAAGINQILTLDIHSKQQQGFFSIPFDSLTAIWLLLEQFRKTKKVKFDENLVVVSPDYGGVKRARSIAEKINASLAIVDKRRPKPNCVEVVNLLGDVKNKNCIIIDDMIDTGGTIMASCNLLKKHGAKSINVLVTHGLFNNDAIEKFDSLHKKKVIDSIFVTNSIKPDDSLPKFITVVDISKMLADAIKVFANENESLSVVYHKYKYFKDFE